VTGYRVFTVNIWKYVAGELIVLKM
jgi:hypothetical protein